MKKMYLLNIAIGNLAENTPFEYEDNYDNYRIKKPDSLNNCLNFKSEVMPLLVEQA